MRFLLIQREAGYDLNDSLISGADLSPPAMRNPSGSVAAAFGSAEALLRASARRVLNFEREAPGFFFLYTSKSRSSSEGSITIERSLCM